MISGDGLSHKLPDELAERIGRLPAIRPAAVLRWLSYLHEDRPGWLEIGTRTADRAWFETAWFRWPGDRYRVLHHIVSRAGTHDVWMAALLKQEQQRGTELPGRYAWCDADTGKLSPNADAEIESLDPAIVLSGSLGNRQVWVRLPKLSSPAEIRLYNKGLIARIGGDPKHSPDSIMRVPGTLNHKACEDGVHRCKTVIWQQRAGAAVEDDLSASTEDTGTDFDMPDPVDIGTPPEPLRRALQGLADGMTPSEHTQHVAYVAASLFQDDGQVLAALEQDDVTAERRADPKHRQPGWWPGEFRRVLEVARSRYPANLSGKTVAAVLVNMALAQFTFGMASDGEPYALPRGGPQVVRMLRGDRYSLRSELALQYSEHTGHPPGNGGLADALVVLEGMAQKQEPVELPMRCARYGDSLVLDLGDTTGRAVVVRPGSWEVVERSPILFRRTRLTAALPVPLRGRKLTECLFPLINIPRDDWSLMAAVMVSTLVPDIPHPIPHLTGGEGVAKTSTTRVLRSLTDPSSVPTRGKPDEKDWDVALSAQWIVALDNLSSIPEWLSDALCRAVTGEGTVKRKLYTDADMSMIAARRVMIINGISTVIANADLAGRTITFELEPVRAYRSEVELAAEWQANWPYALGALLDQAADVLGALPDLPPLEGFRMADFAKIVQALDKVSGTFALDAYRSRLEAAAEDVIHGDVVADALLDWGRKLDEPWEGSIKGLSETLITYLGGRPAGWPKSPEAMVIRLRRVGAVLRRAGVVVDRLGRTKHGSTWTVTHRA